MKKIIVIILISFFVFVKNINAETIYGEYYKVNNIDLLESDEVKVDTYKIYNTYKLEYEDLGYLEESNEYIKDNNDYIYEERVINNYFDGDEYILVNVEPINDKKIHIKFGNISNLQIYELEIYYKDKKIDYMVSNINDIEINNIFDNNLETFYTHKGLSYINFKFQDSLDLENITFVIYTKKGKNSNFLIYMDDRPKIVLNNSIDRRHIINFNLIENNDIKVEYFYKEKIKLYKYYKENKIKEDIYVRDGDNLILDDYKIINDYYKRDKLVLSDNLLIDNKDKDIQDFIIYSSGEVITECNINYEINGIYKCNFILNDIDVEKDIYVDIENKDNKESINESIIENVFMDNNTSIQEVFINELEVNSSDKTIAKDSSKYNFIKKNLSANDKENIKESKINNNIKTTEIKKDLVLLNNKTDNVNNNYIKIIKFIIIIILIFIDIIIVIKKKKR